MILHPSSLARRLRRLVDPAGLGAARSGQWPAVRRRQLAKHPDCAACGRHGTLLRPNDVHHVEAFHRRPDLELDPTNLVTLCRVHHKVFGHADDWRAINPHCRGDAAVHRRRVEARS